MPGLFSRPGQVRADCEPCQRYTVVELELVHDILAVTRDGAVGPVELLGDLFDRVALGGQRQDFTLAGREHGQQVFVVLIRPLEIGVVASFIADKPPQYRLQDVRDLRLIFIIAGFAVTSLLISLSQVKDDDHHLSPWLGSS